MGNYDTTEKFCGKITALFLPYLRENIPDKEWLRFQEKIEMCFLEFANAHFAQKPEQELTLPAMSDTIQEVRNL